MIETLSYNTLSAEKLINVINYYTDRNYKVEKIWYTRVWLIFIIYNVLMVRKPEQGKMEIVIGPITSRLSPVKPANDVKLELVIGPIASK